MLHPETQGLREDLQNLKVENRQRTHSGSYAVWGRPGPVGAACEPSYSSSPQEVGKHERQKLAALAWRSPCGFLEKYLSGFPLQLPMPASKASLTVQVPKPYHYHRLIITLWLSEVLVLHKTFLAPQVILLNYVVRLQIFHSNKNY